MPLPYEIFVQPGGLETAVADRGARHLRFIAVPELREPQPKGTEDRPTGAEQARWNLADLYPDLDSVDRDLLQAQEEADSFESRFRGRVAELTPRDLSSAIEEFENILVRLGRSMSYAYLDWCTDTEDPERGALLQKTREAYTQTIQSILFFELEWVALEDDQARRFLSHPELRRFHHYLELERRRKPHVLSEAEEKIFTEKSVTGRSAWNRFFDEAMGATRFALGKRQLTQQETLAKLYEPDRRARRRAAEAFTKGLEGRLRETAFVFNVTLADKASNDRLRQYPNWLRSRNLDNEISDEAVEVLVDSVSSRYDLVARFYRLKRSLLGLDQLFDYDRYAPVGSANTFKTWEQARSTVIEAYDAFHPKMGKIAREFFDKRWIDAPPGPGKSGGAFSHPAVPTIHPYILMNYSGNIRDIQTLAHELGHGVHQYLSQKQGYLQSRPPLTTSETASVFGEMLVFDHLMKTEKDTEVRLSILVATIDDTIATVFRQVAMHRFEERIHTARRDEGELATDRLSQLWMETQEEMFQGSVTLKDHYRIWWSYIPHFIHTPGYVYAYAFGKLLVLALYHQQGRENFAEEYLDLLESGGSDWPQAMIGKLGVDLDDSDLWNQGLSITEDLIRDAEELAKSLNGRRP